VNDERLTMLRVLLYLLPVLWLVAGTACGPVCATDDECAVGAYCTAAGDCARKACQPSAGNTLGPDDFVRGCQCDGNTLRWERGADNGACTFGCELTWTPASMDCAAVGTTCEEHAGDSERPVVGCF
jgi:hypothetical protein